VIAIADRVIAMRHGRIVFDLPGAQVTEELVFESIAGTVGEAAR